MPCDDSCRAESTQRAWVFERVEVYRPSPSEERNEQRERREGEEGRLHSNVQTTKNWWNGIGEKREEEEDEAEKKARN